VRCGEGGAPKGRELPWGETRLWRGLPEDPVADMSEIVNHLVQDSEDEDDECNEEEDEGEDEELKDENSSASDTDSSLLGGNSLFAGLIFVFIDSNLLYSLISIYFAGGEEIDCDEIQSDRFNKDGFYRSGPTVRVRQLPALVLANLNMKFRMFYTNQGAEWEN
jgi:hypothetical protein